MPRLLHARLRACGPSWRISCRLDVAFLVLFAGLVLVTPVAASTAPAKGDSHWLDDHRTVTIAVAGGAAFLARREPGEQWNLHTNMLTGPQETLYDTGHFWGPVLIGMHGKPNWALGAAAAWELIEWASFPGQPAPSPHDVLNALVGSFMGERARSGRSWFAPYASPSGGSLHPRRLLRSGYAFYLPRSDRPKGLGSSLPDLLVMIGKFYPRNEPEGRFAVGLYVTRMGSPFRGRLP